MTEREALLAAVIASPDDDLPRLAYADWLDEHAGEVECDQCKGKQVAYCTKCKWGQGRLSNHFAERAEFIRCEVASVNPELPKDHRLAAAGRAATLLADHSGRWVPRFEGRLTWERGFVSEVACELAVWVGGRRCGWCGWCGGTGEAGQYGVCSPCRGSGRTVGVGAAVVAEHPVEVVKLTVHSPYHNGGGYCWYNEDRREPRIGGEESELPGPVYTLLPWPHANHHNTRWTAYASYGDAVSALSDALIAFARSQAGRAAGPALLPLASPETAA
jgi:uncharacterized protein (TIGR02996 family)